MEIKGRLALVTGASRGIGRQIAYGLAEKGCDVILHARTVENTHETAQWIRSKFSVQVHQKGADLNQPTEVSRFLDEINSEFGAIDLLINNAAYKTPNKPIQYFSPEDWKTVFQVNLFSLVKICNAIVPEMALRKFGRVVNLTTLAKDLPEFAPYCASKTAVNQFTADLSVAYKNTGVLINLLDPGWVKTDLGGPHAECEVESILPLALVPLLLDNDGPTGKLFFAQKDAPHEEFSR